MSRCGTGDSHCCWLGVYGECPYVQPTDNPPFKWKCSLRAELGDWQKAHADPRYLANVKPKLVEIGIAADCGDWEPPNRCTDCGIGLD